MTFVPDNDTNYQAFLKARAAFSGPDAQEFTKQFLQYLGDQATTSVTANSTVINNAIAAAKNAVRQSKNLFPTNANYVSAVASASSFSGNDFFDCVEHFVKGIAALATAGSTLNSAAHTTVVSNAKTATKAAKHTY
jgi:hypothetical protein